MRTYFFGDIHGNVPALEACLRHLEKERADEVFCLGDLAGWLPFGDRTVDRLRSENFPTVAGNHDLLVVGAMTDHPGQLDRMQATAYNAGLLFPMPGAIDYLAGLPLVLERADFTVVHHSPFSLPAKDAPLSIESFGYLDEAALARSIAPWRQYGGRLIFSGHDHVPAVYELPADEEKSGPGGVKVHRIGPRASLTVRLTEGSRYWVKAGSVGGPYRDGVARANAVLYDSGSETIALFRISYDASRLLEELSSHRFCRNLATIGKYIDLLRAGTASRAGR